MVGVLLVEKGEAGCHKKSWWRVMAVIRGEQRAMTLLKTGKVVTRTFENGAGTPETRELEVIGGLRLIVSKLRR